MRIILAAAIVLLCLSHYAEAQRFMLRPGAYYPFYWGTGRYWGGWGGWAPGPRYYNPGDYHWQGWQRWHYMPRYY